ncbi:MAG TPA: family 1 encapsulin nanocompartment shell protein [Solirubrobacteraceae bacterium]|nr:family 1 encapsulin nanocompartment shell protein [Solirubrobacteraceae bacterium]
MSVNVGRAALDWPQEQWDRLDRAVHDEATRSGVAATLIPLVGPFPDVLTVPADVISPGRLAIDEGQITPLVELQAAFTLTQQQADGDPGSLTAITLAVRATSLIVLAEDLLIFRGDAAALPELVGRRGSIGIGLVDSAPDPVIPVAPAEDGHFGERTFAAVVEAIAELGTRGHVGPYAVALHSELYADSFAPLPGTLIAPADRIRPLATQGFAGTGALPAGTGVVFSVGGNVIDLVIGVDPLTSFTQVGADGMLQLRVFERFALRIKDATAIVRLRFGDG